VRSRQPSPLRVAIYDPLGNGAVLAEALKGAGHTVVEEGHADALLIETDMPKFEFREIIDRHKAMGAKVFVYPHGAGLPLLYDNLCEPYEAVDGSLLLGVGHAELLRRLDYPHSTHVVGWYFNEPAPFRATDGIRHVVFAPTHPSGVGHTVLAEHYRASNVNAFEQLIKGPWRLTVRLFGTPEQNGLWDVEGVNFVPSRREKLPLEIEAADAVVAGAGSFPTLAIARGIPTVMSGQLNPPQYGLPDEPILPLRRTERYADYVRYPFDVADGPLDEVLHAAARGEAPIAEWKRRFVGAPFHPDDFAARLERLVRATPQPVELDATRGFTVVAFADELLERPELLASYAERFGPDDDATLVVWGVGVEADVLLAMVQVAVEAAGVGDDRQPDILLLPLPGSPEVDRVLAERARAVLSEWPPVGRLGGLPRFGGAEAGRPHRRTAV
jgi:hypothetical protein